MFEPPEVNLVRIHGQPHLEIVTRVIETVRVYGQPNSQRKGAAVTWRALLTDVNARRLAEQLAVYLPNHAAEEKPDA